jgi:hypothetical protein
MNLAEYPQQIRDDIANARRVWIDFVAYPHHLPAEAERLARRWYEAVNLVASDLGVDWSNARAVILCQ